MTILGDSHSLYYLPLASDWDSVLVTPCSLPLSSQVPGSPTRPTATPATRGCRPPKRTTTMARCRTQRSAGSSARAICVGGRRVRRPTLRARRTKSSDDPPLPPQSDVSPRILSLSCPNANQHVRSRPIPVRPFPGDGAQMPNNRCSNCVSYRLECTYVEAAKVRPTMLPPSPARAQLPTEARPSQGVRTLSFPARVTR